MFSIERTIFEDVDNIHFCRDDMNEYILLNGPCDHPQQIIKEQIKQMIFNSIGEIYSVKRNGIVISLGGVLPECDYHVIWLLNSSSWGDHELPLIERMKFARLLRSRCLEVVRRCGCVCNVAYKGHKRSLEFLKFCGAKMTDLNQYFVKFKIGG